jgi:hypothetical protein
MRREIGSVLWLLVFACAPAGWAGQAIEYPVALSDIYDADQSCWNGMGETGQYPTPVIPERWLVGVPPSHESAVTLPVDHWVELVFSGRLVDGEGSDITVEETGRAGEQALLFVTDGADQEYLLTKLVVDSGGGEQTSLLDADLHGILLPFEPRAVRIVALDRGGLSPGFDVAHVQARVAHDGGTQACCPNPVSGAARVSPRVKLTWAPGFQAKQHIVYFGDSRAEVRSRAPGVRYATQDVNTFEPPGLLLGQTYYWCVDEIGLADANHPQRGDVWSLAVSDHLVVDDFERYVLGPVIYEVWQPRGWTGVSVESQVFDTCQYSMILGYYYDATSRSELVRRFEPAQDWTPGGAQVLQLLLHGPLPDPAEAEMYVLLTDGVNEHLVAGAGVAAVEGRPDWYTWRVPLEALRDIDLTQVRGMAVGVRPLPSLPPDESCRGNVGIAEIGLYRTVCRADRRPGTDLTGDCTVDYRDLERMARDWLEDRTRALPVAAPNEPILWYEFEGNANDKVGDTHGVVEGRVNYVPGIYGQAIHFMNAGDRVVVPRATEVFARVRDAITIAFWQWGDDSAHRNDTLCCSNYIYGESNPALAIHLGCWRDPGQYRWDCGTPWSFDNRLAGRHQATSEWAGHWNHWAFTKDARVGSDGGKGRMEIYLNGELYARRTGADAPITDITSFEIGSGWYGHYDGAIDDFQMYDYALTPAEIAYVATDGTGVFQQRPASPADLDASERVDLHDFALLATEWLQSGLWP